MALADRSDLGSGERQLTLHQLAERCGGWPRLTQLGLHQLLELGVHPEAARCLVSTPPLVTRGQALTLLSSGYPTALQTWAPGPPPVLLVEGTLAGLGRPAIAIVGTRSCSPYGASVAHRLAWACARAGITVVSGLARGVDTHAHLGALSGGGATLAVLGHGLAHTAPPANLELRRRIVAAGGAMISTWPDPTPPSRWSFPHRNQWIAALVRSVVVVEAPERSGSLITARTKLQGTDADDALWVVPGPFGAPGWEGSTQLLREVRARPLYRVEDLVTTLLGAGPEATPGPDWLAAVLAGSDLAVAARIAGLSTVEILQELTRLELAGRVVRLPGGRYAPAGG